MSQVWWYERIESNDNGPLRYALDSGLVTHVVVRGKSVEDEPDAHNRPRWDQIRELCKRANVPWTWHRHLMPYNGWHGFDFSCLFRPSWLEKHIIRIANEARALGAEFAGVDVEVYGKAHCWYKRWASELHADYRTIRHAAEMAAGFVDVDYILPSSAWAKPNLYWALEPLGRLRISEYTYADHPRAYDPRMAHEIRGMALSPIDEVVDGKKLYKVSDVFGPLRRLWDHDGADFWDHTSGGLFIWPHRATGGALAVAKAMCDVASGAVEAQGD